MKHKCRKHKWRVVRTIWPNEDGWVVYCTRCKFGLPFLSDEGLKFLETHRLVGGKWIEQVDIDDVPRVAGFGDFNPPSD